MIKIINKYNQLFNKKQKYQLIIIIIMMVIGAVLETIGVSLILPLVSAIMKPELIENNDYVRSICQFFRIPSMKTFIIVMIFALIGVFILKNIYLFIEYNIQYRFICNNRFETQRKLISSYIQRPYEYFLSINTAEVERVVMGDVREAFGLLTTLLSFMTEVIICLALVMTIIIIDPVMAISIAIILTAVLFLITKAIKPALRKAGILFHDNSISTHKWLLQSITGIKELKITGKESYFIDQFSKYGKDSIEAEKTNYILGTVPRLTIEAMSISGMLGVVAILLIRGRGLDSMLPQLSAFAMAAVRILPSANRMSTAINAISYQEPMLDKMIENLHKIERWNIDDKEQKEVEDGKITLLKEVRLDNITYRYPGASVNVLQNANMNIPVSKSVGIVGVSGAGKTTAIDILLGLLEAQEGTVTADGVDIKNAYQNWLNHLGYIPQMIFMLDDTIKRNIAFGYTDEEICDELLWKALDEAQLSDFVKSLPDGIETTIGERGVRLSGGQRQRIGIARALYKNPELLVFDEATSALDNETEAAIMEAINSLHGKKTLVIIAHRLETIKDCDMIYRVEHGSIFLEHQ